MPHRNLKMIALRVFQWVFLAAIFTFASHANSFEVNRVGNRLILSAKTCEETTPILADLRTWTKAADPKATCRYVQSRQPISTGCSFDISQCVPAQVAKYGGTNPKLVGPNCWNSALVFSKILPSLRMSTQEEMNFYMRSPLCHALSPNEPRRANDVGAIRKQDLGGNVSEEHGFIYVSDRLVYSKDSIEPETSYSLQTLDQVYQTFRVDEAEKCRRNRSASSECSVSVSYFRCDSMESYLKGAELIDGLMQQMNQVSAVECKLQTATRAGAVLSPQASQNVLDVTKAFLHYAKENQKVAKAKHDEKSLLVLKSLRLRLEAITYQLSFMGEKRVLLPLAKLLNINPDELSTAEELKAAIHGSPSENEPPKNSDPQGLAAPDPEAAAE